MRILRISGKNLASLADEFCVDFEAEPLASSGLFAISGPTGAGKSTLLDALCLALYDATPRLLKSTRGGNLMPDVGTDTVSAEDPRTLLRRGTGEAHAEVDFVGNDKIRYRARWRVWRAGLKSTGLLQKSTMSLHRLPELQAIGGTKKEVTHEIALRIGLSFEQFTRAVLLAQNEFSAFLKTEENERGELLETLTGSAIYSDISIRAFERNKQEQERMRLLNQRLADRAPLPAPERAELDNARAAADLALAAAEQAKAQAEQHLRWHQEAARLEQNEALATRALADSEAGRAASGIRRIALARFDAVQPARQLLANVNRLDAEKVEAQAALATSGEQLGRALAAREQAVPMIEAATLGLAAAELSRQDALPRLDQAKALDVEVATLLPVQLEAGMRRDASAREQSLAQLALKEKTDQLALTLKQHTKGTAWLAQNSTWEPLAAQWPRWDQLLARAAKASAQNEALAADLATALKNGEAATRSEAAATAALESSGALLLILEAERQAAIARLATFDIAQMRAQRGAFDQRREALLGAETVWIELAAIRERLRQVSVQTDQLQHSHSVAMASLDQLLSEAPALTAVAAQAEHALKAAELACADSVEDLRATLAHGAPCPVCGSAEHPYQHQNASLHAVFDSLREQVASTGAKSRDNINMQAMQRAIIATSDEQLDMRRSDNAELVQQLAKSEAAWSPRAHACEAPPHLDDANWFVGRHEQLRLASNELDAQESAERQAAVVRDKVQAEYDKASIENTRLREVAVAARTASAQASAAQSTVSDKQVLAQTSLANILDELDGAFAHDLFDHDWRQQWQEDPARFRSTSADKAEQWLAQSKAHAARAASLVTLETEQLGASKRLDQATQSAATTLADALRVDADIQRKQAARLQLWNGEPVAQVEARLAQTIDTARTAVSAAKAGAEQAAHAETSARAAQLHTTERLATVGAAAALANDKLTTWLTAFGPAHPAFEPLTLPELRDLLAQPNEAIEQERAQLREFELACANAAAVLDERRSQREQHTAARPPGAALATADEAFQALEISTTQRTDAHAVATGLRLQLAQDEARRTQSSAIMAELEQQQLVERRWAQMNELIGSADGKKFRNYAQQFTLDVLLDYANGHLAQLARRYRLERVPSAAGPALGLLVRDQDMGGEVRSVNSLSGGESFLVSLGLALGLASLSSNRVRVESLFIDEGFGGLDSETLRIALDALDGLQSTGRKVGVISHVQDMTDRIATRILVRPAGGGASSVTVQ